MILLRDQQAPLSRASIDEISVPFCIAYIYIKCRLRKAAGMARVIFT